ncbi:MAG: hypothetical protein HW403_191, partial [Dehalococcoidia bacterium]|nr:hypothetical protein [Dehalococcoidia bacterium]
EPEEVTALSRRIYIFMILFVAVLAILFNGAQALNGLLRLVLGEPASRRFLSSLFTNMGNVTVVGLFLFYHWRVLQRDRVVIGAMPQQRSIAVTALAADVFQGKVNQLQEALGSKVALLREVSHTEGIPDIHEGGFSPDELADIMSKVHDSPSAKVLLVFTSSGVEVHPYT